MNSKQLQGKLEQVQGDAKIWLGKTTNNPKIELDGKMDKMKGELIEQSGDALAKYEKAKEAFETKKEEVQSEIKLKWDKFNNEDIKEIDQSFDKLASKLKEKYNHTQKEVNENIQEFMAKF